MILYAFIALSSLQYISADTLLHRIQINDHETLPISNLQCDLHGLRVNDTHLVVNSTLLFNAPSVGSNDIHKTDNYIDNNYKLNVETVHLNSKFDDYIAELSYIENESIDKSVTFTRDVLHQITDLCMSSKSALFSAIRKGFIAAGELGLSNDALTEYVITHVLDKILEIVKEEVMIKTNGVLDLPPIERKTDGNIYINAYNGKFWNIADVQRIYKYDIHHNKVNKQFSLFTVFALPEAHAKYIYTASYSFLSTSGNFHIDMRNFKMGIAVGLDYFNVPCQFVVNDITVDFLDVDVKLTGFGWFNTVVSEYVQSLILQYKKEMTSVLARDVKQLVQEAVSSKFNCEKFNFNGVS